MNLAKRVSESKNMIEVESLILTQVSNKYMMLFAETERKFIRAKELQDEWIRSVWMKYAMEAQKERTQLFSMIPNKLHGASLYLKLQNDLLRRSASVPA